MSGPTENQESPNGDGLNLPALIARARAGDDAAIREILGLFEDDVRRMVRSQLPRALRSQFDSMDFAQAVWQSFFEDLKTRSEEFESASHLRGFLKGVARNKVFEQYRRLTRTEKYSLAKEERLYVRRGDREVTRELPSPGPTPSQTFQAGDRLAKLTAGRPPREVEILTLRHQGMTIEEIAHHIGINERTVRRTIDAARLRMEAEEWDC